MHIPSEHTQSLAIEPFSASLSASEETTLYDKARWILIPPRYDEYRYVLGTRGEHPLICAGINPSTAMPDALDRTLQSVQRIAERNGFDSFLMFNVYAQRATRPKDMDSEMNPALHTENMKAFRWLLSLTEQAPTVWAAWGAIIETRPYLADCLSDMLSIGREMGARWVQAGQPSKKGHPHHPLYLRSDSSLYPFPAREYLLSLQTAEGVKKPCAEN